jgi:hypothetical protein
MVTERVEGVDIQAGAVRSGKALAEFQIENQVTETLAFDQVIGRLC